MKLSRRSLGGFGLSAIIGGPSAAKEVLSNVGVKTPGVAMQATQESWANYSDKVQVPREATFGEIQHQLNNMKNNAAHKYMDDDDEYRHYKNMRIRMKHSQLKSLKSVSKAVKEMSMQEFEANEDEKYHKWHNQQQIKGFLEHWLKKFPFLKA